MRTIRLFGLLGKAQQAFINLHTHWNRGQLFFSVRIAAPLVFVQYMCRLQAVLYTKSTETWRRLGYVLHTNHAWTEKWILDKVFARLPAYLKQKPAFQI